MVLVDDDIDHGGISLIWIVQNFINCMQDEGEFIQSPVYTIKGTKWRLRLYPRGCWVPGFLDFYLEVVSKDIKRPIEVDCVLSIRSRKGTFLKMEDKKFKFKSVGIEGFSKLLPRRQFMETCRRNEYLENDELTIRCRIRKYNNELPESVRCYARTNIGVTKIAYPWNVESFLNGENKCLSNRSVDVQHNLTDVPSLTLELNTGGSCIEDLIHVMIRQIDTDKPNLLACKVSLLDAGKRLCCFVEGEHRFRKSQDQQTWSLSLLPKRKLLAQKELYLSNNTLSLHFEFTFSLGVESSEMEQIEYGTELIQQTNNSDDVKGSDSVVDAWIENLKRLVEDGKFSDVIVRTPNKDFPVHKAFLCAQSEKFSEMFGGDSKENRTSVVEIDDWDDETIFKMLRFIYTCSAGPLEWEIAKKLYNVAGMFAIGALVKICSLYFREHITIVNVCEVLVLAETNKDNELKSDAQNFISEHADEVFNSEYWTKLMGDKEKARLTLETMHLHISKSCKSDLHSKK